MVVNVAYLIISTRIIRNKKQKTYLGLVTHQRREPLPSCLPLRRFGAKMVVNVAYLIISTRIIRNKKQKTYLGLVTHQRREPLPSSPSFPILTHLVVVFVVAVVFVIAVVVVVASPLLSPLSLWSHRRCCCRV